LVVWTIDLAPTGAAGGAVCVFDYRKIGAIVFSCSLERISPKTSVQWKMQPEMVTYSKARIERAGCPNDFEMADAKDFELRF